MKTTKTQLFPLFAKGLLSFFAVGYIPKAPGTFGSLATIPLIYWIQTHKVSLLNQVLFYTALTIVAIALAQWIQKREGLKDPQWIVLDEVVGMLFASLALKDVSFLSLGILFGLFRFFDIIKFWPASYFDKLDHGAGTILDDVISGFFTFFLMLLVNNFI